MMPSKDGARVAWCSGCRGEIVYESLWTATFDHDRHLAYDVIAPYIVEQRALTLEVAAVEMSGIGEHREPCRLPDTSCLCGVCDFRAAARQALVDRAAWLRDTA